MPNSIAISQFKSHCLEIIEEIKNSKQPVIITKRNKPIAIVEPITFNDKTISLFGLLKDKAEIKGDIIEEIDEKWTAEYE